jgi:hypothetical protein
VWRRSSRKIQGHVQRIAQLVSRAQNLVSARTAILDTLPLIDKRIWNVSSRNVRLSVLIAINMDVRNVNIQTICVMGCVLILIKTKQQPLLYQRMDMDALVIVKIALKVINVISATRVI